MERYKITLVYGHFCTLMYIQVGRKITTLNKIKKNGYIQLIYHDLHLPKYFIGSGRGKFLRLGNFLGEENKNCYIWKQEERKTAIFGKKEKRRSYILKLKVYLVRISFSYRQSYKTITRQRFHSLHSKAFLFSTSLQILYL